MKLVNLSWSRYCVPFRVPFHTAHGALSYRAGALVTMRTDAGFMGIGEIAPLPEQSGQSLGDSLKALPRLAHTLQNRELSDILRFVAAQSADGQLPAPLICGLETALLDALAQADHQRVADLLICDYSSGTDGAVEVPRPHVPVNAVIGGADIAATIAHAQTALAAGFTCLKLKLTDATTALARVAAVRAAIGPTPRLRLDANAGWNYEQARTLLAQCAAYDIEYIEQPLPAHDLPGMASLRRVSPVPLAADEALTGLGSARRILQARAADILILKPQLAGGLRICRQIIQEAHAQGVTCVLTSTLETGLGVAATLHLAAASPEITLPCGLATLNLLADDLLQTSLLIQQSRITLPSGPGLGVHLNQVALDRYGDAQPLEYES